MFPPLLTSLMSLPSSFSLRHHDQRYLAHTQFMGIKYSLVYFLILEIKVIEFLVHSTEIKNLTETHGQVFCFYLSEQKHVARQKV